VFIEAKDDVGGGDNCSCKSHKAPVKSSPPTNHQSIIQVFYRPDALPVTRLVMPKTVREMTQLPKETQKNGDTNKSKRTNKHAKHKPRLNMHTKTHSAQPGCMNWSW